MYVCIYIYICLCMCVGMYVCILLCIIIATRSFKRSDDLQATERLLLRSERALSERAQQQF